MLFDGFEAKGDAKGREEAKSKKQGVESKSGRRSGYDGACQLTFGVWAWGAFCHVSE
jgi:hypothetical protein